MVIAHNLLAMNSENCYVKTIKNRRNATEKLSSGYKINRSADDAAGLSISEKMRNQIRNLNQGIKNAEDGISLVQTADGALSEVHSILHRIEELSVQAANDTYTDEDRACIDEEVAELQEEIKKVFRDTEFNTKKLFSAPYVPTISGQPNDLEVFMTGSNQYGGIRVNNVRYTWGELNKLTGKDIFGDDGTHFQGGRYSFTTYDGEDVTFDTRAGGTPPNIFRLYQWEATEAGIYINDVFASRWEDMGIDKNNIQSGTCKLTFHGMDVAFEIPDEDDGISMMDLLKKINNDGFSSKVNWSASAPYGVIQNAVRIRDYSTQLTITDAWKDKTSEYAGNLKLEATDEGIILYSKNKDNQYVRLNGQTDNTIPDMKWTDIPDISTSGKKHPIVDWGTASQEPSNSSSQITLSEDGLYRFTEPVTGMEIQFRLSNEASLQQVKAGLTNEFKTNINAPVGTIYSDTGVNLADAIKSHFHITGLTSNFSYNLQRDTGKSFDLWNTTEFTTSFSVLKDTSTEEIIMIYEVKDNSGKSINQMKETLDYDDFYGYVTMGNRVDYSLQSSGTDRGSISFRFQTDAFNQTITQEMEDRWNKTADQSAKILAEKDKKNVTDAHAQAEADKAKQEAFSAGKGSDQANEAYRTTYDRVLKEDQDNTYQASYKLNYNTRYNQERKKDEKSYVDNALSYLQQMSVTTRQTAPPTITTSINTSNNSSMHTRFGGVLLNPPKKNMYVQSGANAGEDVYMEWPAMSLSMIGLGGATVKNRESAVACMTQIQTALNVVSEARSGFGAYQNRLEYEVRGNRNYSENLTNAESQIRDTDMAETAMEYAKTNILSQINEAMLAQANQSKQGVLSMLQ